MVRETRHLWVGNLPHTIREERILDHFKRYGKVQSVKILPKKEDDNNGGACATVAFIDIKSAAKAHNADNKIEDRTLKTDYYEPPASSTASSAIYIHERDDALVRTPTAPYSTPRTPRYGLSEERNYERPGHYYNDREPYLRRPLGMGYHDEDNYQGRAKSRDRYSRSNSGTTYTEGTDRNQNHFRSHNTRQHFEQQRYPVGEQYNDEREPAGTTPRLNRRTNNSAVTPVVASVASPTTTRSESRPRRTKRRSPSRTPSGSRSNSGSHSRSRSRSSSGSRSSSSSSKLRSSSSDSSGRSRSPSKSRSPAASYGSASNPKGSRLDRPSSAITNPSSSVSYLPSTVNTSAINCTPNNTQGSTPTQQGCPLDSLLQNHCDKEEKRPLGICVRNLPVRSTDTSLKDGLFHEYKKHGKVTMVKVIGQGTDRYAVVCFKKPEDVDKALEVSKDKLFFGCKIEVTAHEGLDAEDNEFRPLEAELDEFHPKATRTLFIGNLEKDITTNELRKQFEQFGEIIEIDIKKQVSATSYAFIQYSDIGSVVKAMRKLDGENLGANRIKLGFGKSMPTNCVWLDGIVDSVSDKFLARHFSRFGIVAYTAVDREKGHALVFYESVEFAQIAVSEMRGRILQGKKLQVDFASRECQTTFFDKLEMTGQLLPEDGSTRPWDRRERRGPEFEVVRTDDREPRVGFEARPYQRYEGGQPRTNRGNFRGNQRAGFPGRGRGQNFAGRYEVYHDEFGERRHRYNSRDDTEVTLFDGKSERLKYTETPDCPTRKRNKLRNSISDQESHHSQSPPRSRHQSRSTSPVSKERKSIKDRIHHRIKSPGSHTSSVVNSPCRDTLIDDLETNSEYRESRSKNSDTKIEDYTDLSYASPRSSSEKESFEKILLKSECDSFRSRSSLDAESADESGINSDQLGQIERKKRLLASNIKSGKDSKSGSDKIKPKNNASHNSLKFSKANCLSEATVEELKSELESVNIQYECAKEKSQNSDCANSEMKYLKKKQVQILHLLDQLHESVNSSDNDCSVDSERLPRKKYRALSCIETNCICENDIAKCHTKEGCGSKLCKGNVKDHAVIAKLKKSDNTDGNCISLDSFNFHKHLDPRKQFDQHSLATVNSLKCRRISVDNDTCLPNSHGTSESFLCVSSSVTADFSWKKHNSLNDINFSENETDSSMTLSHIKIKQEFDDELLCRKSHLTNSHSAELPKSHLLRGYSEPCHEIKRERDISPLSLPLPKFAASLRSPKSLPSILTSPKSTSAHSPRAGLSPCYSLGKSIRIPDLLHDIPSEKKPKDLVPEEKMNGANISPLDSVSLFEPPTNDSSESIPSVEPIQSPKCNFDKIKEECIISSSESDFSPSSSPNRPSIEDRIKALDEKFNAWSVNTRTISSTIADVTISNVVPDLTPKCSIKRSRFSYLADTKREPSEIVKTLLAHSSILEQDSQRLQHVDEKYEPLNVKLELSPKVKPTFRTKAAAKEFSSPITPSIQTLNQSLLVKTPPAALMVAQGIISPPATPQSSTCSIMSPITPPVSQYTQLPTSMFTPCSPRASSFGLSSTLIKTSECLASPLEKDVNTQILKSPQLFNTAKAKVDPNFHANSAVHATSLKSSPLTCPSETPSHGSIVTALPLRKEPASPTEAVTENVCKAETECKVSIKKDLLNSASIPTKKDSSMLSITQGHSHFNSIDKDKKEFCDSKDPRLSFSDEVGSWRENGCKEEIKVQSDSCAKSYPCSDVTEKASVPAGKKRVSSIDSTESDSSKPAEIHPEKLSHEFNRDDHESSWAKPEKISEPEPKRPKLNKSVRDRSLSPPVHQASKKSDKKEKSSSKSEKYKTSTKTESISNCDKVRHEIKYNNKSESKDKEKLKQEHKSSKEEKRSKSKDSSNRNESRSKPRERRNSEKDKSTSSNKSSKKELSKESPKESSNKESSRKVSKESFKELSKELSKESSERESCKESSKKELSKNEKSSEKKQTERKPRSKSNEFDFSAWLDDEPVYFSMYDKVKARSSKQQTLKHQTNDLESVRQKFSKLKQKRRKRDDKSKSFDQDTDKDSDSTHHSSDSESDTKPPKVKQQRKRKLLIDSSSSEDIRSQEATVDPSKVEKSFQTDSATDSDFDYNVSHRQNINKSRKKKTELLDSDSSDSDSNFAQKSQNGRKKSCSNRSKGRVEKSKKTIKTEDEISDLDISKIQKHKEKPKKIKKDKDASKPELESMECDLPKKLDEPKNNKKKFKEVKSETDLSPVQKKFKSEHLCKEKNVSAKDKKSEQFSEKVHSSEETEKHKPYTKKRKKSKKMSRNKDKRSSDKGSHDIFRKHSEENDTKSSLPVLLSPKPSSSLIDKQLSPPCLRAGIMSDNDYKSDYSDFEYETQPNEESRDVWKHLESKSDTNSEKSSKHKKELLSKSDTIIRSPEQDSSLPSFFDKLSDITDSETGKEITDLSHDIPLESSKQISFSSRKEKDFMHISLHKSKHEKHDNENASKQSSSRHSDTHISPSKEERRRKKSKKQNKERKKKSYEDKGFTPSSKTLKYENIGGGDEDSRLSDIRLDEDIAEEARRLEQELLAASEETSTFGDEGPVKREGKRLERRFEEEAAKETRRLEAELLSTGRDSWHMKEKEYDSDPNSGDLCEDKLSSEIDPMTGKDENMFAGLEMHSSVGDSSQHEADAFLSGHSESDPYKIDDKDVANEIEDQRKIEDDLAVSALLQEMHCGEISAPELTKEADYLEMVAHPEETMNYLLPDDGENSLHIADSPVEDQVNDSQGDKLDSEVHSPSSNSEPPPALEISTVESSVIMKFGSEHKTPEILKIDGVISGNKASCYEFHEESRLEICESKPPVIDHQIIQDGATSINAPLSPRSEFALHHKRKIIDKHFRIPAKPDPVPKPDDTDDDCSSDLARNQLAHFEDITNDTADSKDDDNPPILLPVQSPPNLLPVSNSKEHLEPLHKVTADDNQCLDRIIGKAPSTGNTIFEKDSDLDKQIGDIINSITESKKQISDSDRFQIPVRHNISQHNITDPLGLNSSANFFERPKHDNRLQSHNFDPAEIVNPSEKVINRMQSNLSISYSNEDNNKFRTPQTSGTCIIEPSILSYSNILNSNCETSVIQTTQKMDNDAVTISITEKSNVPIIQQFHENRPINISGGNASSSDNFLLELFGPKPNETFKIQTRVPYEKNKSISEPKTKHPEPELPPINFGFQQEIKPLFEIPEINEQNEATEFNQEIFERPIDQIKESIPRLLNFSSESLFSESSTKKENVDNCHNDLDSNVSKAKKENISPSKPEVENSAEYPSTESESNNKVKIDVNDMSNEGKDETFNIEDNFESKTRPADSESVCSDTTDITIPETKADPETNQVTSSEEHVHEDVCPVEEIAINTKPIVERPRRGRRPKTRRYVEAAAQKQDIQSGNQIQPVNMRITRRGAGRFTTERTRRSLRSDTSELHDSHDKQSAVEEIVLIDTEDSKKEGARDTSNLEGMEAENFSSHVETESKYLEKPAKYEEPKKRRGRRKKNSGDHLDPSNDHKSEDSEHPKCFIRSAKDTRLQLSSSEKEQKSALDVYDFTDNEDEDVKFESVKGLHDTTRTSSATVELKQDNKVFDSLEKEKVVEEIKLPIEEQTNGKSKSNSRSSNMDPKHESKVSDALEKTEKVKEEQKTQSDERTSGRNRSSSRISNFDSKHDVSEKKEKAFEDLKTPIEDKPNGRHKSNLRSSTVEKHVVELAEKKEKVLEEIKSPNVELTNGKNKSNDEQDTASKEHSTEAKELPKISKVILRKKMDGHNTKSRYEAVTVEESKTESTKHERNVKHETTEATNTAPCKTRKSARLINQAAVKNTWDEVIEDVAKGNFKAGSNNNSAANPEPVPIRVTRRSRSSRHSEESIPLVSESSEDATEDKNKNEPVYFIPDNSVKEFPLDTKKTNSVFATESTLPFDSSAASVSEKNNDDTRKTLRNYRITRAHTKLDAQKDASQTSTSSTEPELPKKDSNYNATAEEKFDALCKEIKNSKEAPKDLKSTSSENIANIHPLLPELKVEIPRLKEIPKPNEEDSNSRSSLPLVLDEATGVLSVSKLPELSPKTSNTVTTVNSPSTKNSKTPIPETTVATSVIYESIKINPSDEHPITSRAPLVQNLRSRTPVVAQPPLSIQDNTSSSPVSDSISTIVSNDKSIENVKKPAKKSCSVVPVVTMANPAVSGVPIITSNSNSIPVTSTQSLPIVSQAPVITSLGISATTLTSSYTNDTNKDDHSSMKIAHTPQGFLRRAIVTAVVTQVTAGLSSTLPSLVQPNCSNIPVSTSSVLIAPEPSILYSSANNLPPPISEHSSNSCKSSPLMTPVTHEPLSISHGKEAHTYSSSSVTTTWSSSKVSSSRIMESHSHVSTIQTSSTSNPVFTTKSDSRSSKMPHVGKTTAAFPQQSPFTHANFDASLPTGGMIVDLLQNPQILQQQHKEFFAAAVASGQLDRMQSQIVRPTTPVASSIPPDKAARLCIPTPPQTPPVTSSNHSIPADMHPAHINSPLHLRHTQQPSLIVPSPHSNMVLHPSEINAYGYQFYASPTLNPFDAQVIGMNPRFAFPIQSTIPNNYRQPSDSRHQMSVMEPKSEQKAINDLSKIGHESRGPDGKIHTVKPSRIKKEDKVSHSEREDHDSRHHSAHDKIQSTSPMTPHAMRQQQHAAHYPSGRQTKSPHDRITDSPIPYSLVPRVPLIDDHKSDSLSLTGHHYKNDGLDCIKQPPAAHQPQPSTVPYHSLEAAVLSRQQMLGVIGSPAPMHPDGRPPSHSQQSLQHPNNDKRMSSDHPKKVMHSRLHHQPSISPGPVGLAPAHSPLPWHMAHPHSSLGQSPVMSSGDQSSRRKIQSHMGSIQLGPADMPIYAPPPAHALNVPRSLPQNPPPPPPPPLPPAPSTVSNSSQATNEAVILQQYPVMWQGILALKNDQAAVQMHFVSGNSNVAIHSLPPTLPLPDGDISQVRISQRMRLDQSQLEGVQKKLQLMDEHCIMMALPCGKDQADLVNQSSMLKAGFVNYLTLKNAAGIVNSSENGATSGRNAFVIHIFPPCEFVENNLSKVAPNLLDLVRIGDISHLVVIIATV